MRIVSAFLANYAQVDAGLVTAVGAFPSSLDLPRLPCLGHSWLVVVSELARSELGAPCTIDIEVRRTRDDALLVGGTIDVSAEPSEAAPGEWPTVTSAALPVTATFDDVGMHRFDFRRDGGILFTFQVGVRLAAGAPVASSVTEDG